MRLAENRIAGGDGGREITAADAVVGERKLFGPNTHTGPSGASRERMFRFVSIVGSAQEPSSAAAAAWRNWLVVRGSSTSARRGDLARAVSMWAASTISPLRASIRSAKRVKNPAICSGGAARRRDAASAAAFNAARNRAIR